ncbi:MAG: caspase family protein, partial [Magnetococcales bacterium]|nr:caspase family protein [Magnetococcales bacterium]
WRVLSLVVVWWCGFAVEAAEMPHLRIEAGQHVAIINRLALNREGTLLLTVSDDKSARLWEMPEGVLKGVLRVPIGDGVEGALYAGALSPDGHTALVAGAVTNNENSYSLYLFDTATMKMKSRLSKLPATILHLAYSRDGTRFAAVFGDGKGMMAWDAGTGKKLAEDREYGSATANWVTFAGDGRLATSSDDGTVRLYDSQMKWTRSVKTAVGGQPYGLAFSGDDRRLAVGYLDRLRVDLLDVATGTMVKEPDVTGLTGENLSVVTWAGEDLLAAGGAAKGNRRVIRRWAKGGGKPVDVVVAENTITSLDHLPDGKLVYATAEPSWGLVGATGQPVLHKKAPITDFRGIFKHHFALSPDGMVVEWRLRPGVKDLVRFDIAHQELSVNPPREATLAQPGVEDGNVTVTRWENSHSPQLKNKGPLPLSRNEIARALSIAPDGKSFVLGTDFFLRWFDAQGRELVKVDVTGAVYGVNISRDGRYLVAALADGTLHWYRMLAGQPALQEYATLFFNTENRQWIAWSREGLFAHSGNGGKRLAGFHLNRGSAKAPEWIDFGQLYQSFYSPSLLGRKMAGGDGDAALTAQLEQANAVVQRLFAAPVPEVEVVEYCLLDSGATTRGFRRAESTGESPPDCFPLGKGTTRGFVRASAPAKTASADEPVLHTRQLPEGKRRVRLKFRLKERAGGVGELHLLRNGMVVENANAKTRGFARAPAAREQQEEAVILERDLELLPDENLIQMRAFDASNSVHGKSGVVKLIVPPPAPVAGGSARGVKPVMHVLAIGVDQYLEPENRLRFAVKDARAVAAMMASSPSPEYGKVVVQGLYDDQATQVNVLKAFDKLASQIAPEDTVVIYMAGHGTNQDNTYYFITQNARTTDNWSQTAFSQGMLGEKMALLAEKAKKIIMFLDSCHSGAFQVKGKSLDLNQEREGISKVRERTGDLLLVAAAGASQESADEYVDKSGKGTDHGLFAYTVLNGLKGEAAMRSDQEVVASQISIFVDRSIQRISREQPQYTQRPVGISQSGNLNDLNFALTRVQP